MVVGFLLAFIVPSATARAACLVPIMLGFIQPSAPSGAAASPAC